MGKESVEAFKQKMRVAESTKRGEQAKKDIAIKEKEILQLYRAGLNAKQIMMRCHTNYEFIYDVIQREEERMNLENAKKAKAERLEKKKRQKKERMTKEEKIFRLHESGLDVSQIAENCHTSKEFVCAVLEGKVERMQKKRSKEGKAWKKDIDIWEIEREFQEGNYRRVCALAEGDRSALSVKERRIIAQLQKEAMIILTIQQAQKEGKDAAEVAQSLGLPVKGIVEKMGIKVEKKYGTVIYKSKESLRGEEEER